MKTEKNWRKMLYLDKRLWQESKGWWLLGIPIGGLLMFLVGIIFWGGFNTAMEATNSLEFCTSCHEMDIVYEEYKETIHYKNASGVRATCSDCHVPKVWVYKVMRKIKASNEIYHKVMGTIDTPEKFEANRLELAQAVWTTMENSDSRECRNCHSFDSMDLEEQGKSASKRHSPERLAKDDKTCIDCHKGIAHELPDDY